MKMKTLKRALLITATSALVLCLILLIHVAVMVKKNRAAPGDTVQLARADFKEPVDSLSAARIEQNIQKMRGVKSTYFNRPDGILVYAFDNTQNTSRAIYEQGVQNTGFQSALYVVSAGDMKTGCPAILDDSFYGKLTRAVAHLIN